MNGLVVKLLVTPIGIIIASWIFPNVNFAGWYQPIIIGVLLAFVGYAMELAILNENTKWLTVFIDWGVSAIFIYFSAFLFVNTFVSFWGAVLTGALLAVTEIFQHNWLLNSGHNREDPVGD
ncbi:DUF2512 family protein [Virgibacillus kimchii]